jgi:hypothetical protein
METILGKVPQMQELKRRNISKEVETETSLIYKKVISEQKKSEKKESADLDKTIDSF